MAVALVVDDLANTGAGHITLDLARRWAPGGTRLTIIRRMASSAAELPVPSEVTADYLAARPQSLKMRFPMTIFRLWRVARKVKAVVNGSEIGVALILGFAAARLAGKPFVVAVHADLDDALTEWMPRWLHKTYYWIHRHVDGAICVAPGLVAPLVRNGLPEARIRVVRNGIDLAAIQQAAQGPAYLTDTSVPVIVTTGRLAHQKAYDVLLRAHAQVIGQYPHRILMLNNGPEQDALRALAAELGVSDTVTFAGAVRGPLPSVAQASVFCLPSRHEGLPLALLEAVALGTPCIAADCSDGVRAALDDGRVGDLIPVDDVEALAEALRRHFADPTVLRAKAALGPAHAKGFDSDAMARGWANSLQDLVG